MKRDRYAEHVRAERRRLSFWFNASVCWLLAMIPLGIAFGPDWQAVAAVLCLSCHCVYLFRFIRFQLWRARQK